MATVKKTYDIEGMHCGACSTGLEMFLSNTALIGVFDCTRRDYFLVTVRNRLVIHGHRGRTGRYLNHETGGYGLTGVRELAEYLVDAWIWEDDVRLNIGAKTVGRSDFMNFGIGYRIVKLTVSMRKSEKIGANYSQMHRGAQIARPVGNRYSAFFNAVLKRPLFA